uniref:PI3K/PI4K domain-containing protein n=1 Tax=Mesocestoides corti TaxID=53468 RepID=A0A5K3EEY9_MESCO
MLVDLCSQDLVNLVSNCNKQLDDMIIEIVNWLFAQGLVLDEFFLACKPLLLSEVYLAKRLLPWIFAVLFTSLKLSGSTRGGGKGVERALSCLLASLNSLLEHHPQLSGFLQSVLIALHAYSQWLIRSGIARSLEWEFNWLLASKRALESGSSEAACLLFELEWMKRPEKLLHDAAYQNLWIDICESRGDLVGLKAAQTAMAESFDRSTAGASLEDRFRCAINKTNGHWGLLQADRKLNAGENNDGIVEVLLQLHRLGADNAFFEFASGHLIAHNLELQPALLEARYQVSWRTGVWRLHTSPTVPRDSRLLDIDFKCLKGPRVLPSPSPLALQLLTARKTLHESPGLGEVRRERLSRLGQWADVEPRSSHQVEDDKLLHLLRCAVYREDWKLVSDMIDDRRAASIRLLSKDPSYLQSFISETHALRVWSQVSRLLSTQPNSSESRVASSLLLLQASIEEFATLDATTSSPFLEASLCLSEALSDSHQDLTPWLPLLNVHTQLQLADLHVEFGDALFGERLLKSIQPVDVPCPELHLRRHLCLALTRSKLQRLGGEISLSSARLMSVLKETTTALSELKLQRDLPARLLLESYLSCTVVLCKWLSESGTMSWADLIVQLLKPAIDLADRCWPSSTKQSLVTPPPPLYSSADALAALAEFADAQYQIFDGYIRSPEFAARSRLLVDAEADAACLTEVDKKRPKSSENNHLRLFGWEEAKATCQGT